MGGPIRLDIGAGQQKAEGWIKLDFDVSRKKIVTETGQPAGHASPINPDIVCDIRDIPLPDDYADEARAIHVIEHFYPWEADSALKEWIRVLKPGGKLIIECPCLEKILALFAVPKCPPHFTYWGLYGDPRLKDPLMTHKWCYGQDQLVHVMREAGLENLRGQPAEFHKPIRDMRVVGTKPVPEPSLIVTE
jgi:SAM-dependent methyltransferase